jgi:hypothetical protein
METQEQEFADIAEWDPKHGVWIAHVTTFDIPARWPSVTEWVEGQVRTAANLSSPPDPVRVIPKGTTQLTFEMGQWGYPKDGDWFAHMVLQVWDKGDGMVRVNAACYYPLNCADEYRAILEEIRQTWPGLSDENKATAELPGLPEAGEHKLEVSKRQYPDALSHRLEISESFEWVSEWLKAKIDRKVAEMSDPPLRGILDVHIPGKYCHLYGVRYITRAGWAQPVALFQVDGISERRTILSSILYDHYGHWGNRQCGPTEDDYWQGTYHDILDEMRELWPSPDPTTVAIPSAPASVKDDGPGGRAMMPIAELDKLVEGWLFSVKKDGGTTRDDYARGNSVGPATFGRWVTDYKRRHKQVRT